jgi:NAD(P)H-nitrite reductase large subunit
MVGDVMTTIENTKYLIIGNSAGGIGAAEAIREVDGEGTLTIISDEPYHAYSRPLISDYLASHYPLEKMLYRQPDYYEKNGILTVLGEKVTGIDYDKRTVALESGGKVAWEKLLLAAGGAPIFPAMEGNDLKGVFTFNRLDDAKAIDGYLDGLGSRVRAVVIGGGLIGVSVTEALVKRDVRVTIVEMKDRILNTILDEEASAMEAAALAAAGVVMITDHTADRINGYASGEVRGVTLDDGRLLPCELVIVAIGVQPRLDAVTGSGIEINRGIIVDRTMATSVPDVYACGDVAEAYDFVYGINRPTPVWPNAYNGGRTAGLNMAGVPSEYDGGTAMNAIKYFGINVLSAGMVTPPDAGFESVSRRHGDVYKRVILKDGLVVGMVFAGDIEKAGIVYNLMKDRVDVSDFKEALVADDFSLASLPEDIWREKLAILTSELAPLVISEPESEEAVVDE